MDGRYVEVGMVQADDDTQAIALVAKRFKEMYAEEYISLFASNNLATFELPFEEFIRANWE